MPTPACPRKARDISLQCHRHACAQRVRILCAPAPLTHRPPRQSGAGRNPAETWSQWATFCRPTSRPRPPPPRSGNGIAIRSRPEAKRPPTTAPAPPPPELRACGLPTKPTPRCARLRSALDPPLAILPSSASRRPSTAPHRLGADPRFAALALPTVRRRSAPSERLREPRPTAD